MGLVYKCLDFTKGPRKSTLAGRLVSERKTTRIKRRIFVSITFYSKAFLEKNIPGHIWKFISRLLFGDILVLFLWLLWAGLVSYSYMLTKPCNMVINQVSYALIYQPHLPSTLTDWEGELRRTRATQLKSPPFSKRLVLNTYVSELLHIYLLAFFSTISRLLTLICLCFLTPADLVSASLNLAPFFLQTSAILFTLSQIHKRAFTLLAVSSCR